jgi:hypothetical protein
MTRRDYILIAAAIKEAQHAIYGKEPTEAHGPLMDGAAYAAEYIADAIARDNPRGFDRALFLKNAGVQS